MDEEKAIEAVEKITEEILKSDITFDEMNLLEYSTNGYGERIDFLGQQIWSSENQEDRGFDETTDQYEPMEDFLRRSINKFIYKIATIQLNEE
jgi:hypothetical protein